MSPQVGALLAEIKDQGRALDLQVVGARRKLLNAAASLIAALETPVEKITRIAWAEKARILKHLGAMKVLNEPEPGVFGTTQLAEALVIPEYRDSIRAVFDLTSLPLSSLPKYLSKKSYSNPTDPADGPFQYAHNTKKVFFDYLETHPELSMSFNNYMAGHRRGRPNWMDADFYPVQEAVKDIKLDSETPVLVDIGGGKGHDVMEFKKKFPSLPGRLIVQDLPNTIQRVASTHQGIEFLPHDFFTPQPIKGARFYYLHCVLHDWTDDDCRKIIGELKKAMTKGYSKLLVHDNVVPNQNAPWFMTGLDILLMTLVATSERSEKQWRDLLSSAGLSVVKIWNHPEGTESLIETEIA
ncbi:MAG: hypothetical protein Q9204_006395 [Flavoplaca sp. TL-2023a]